MRVFVTFANSALSLTQPVIVRPPEKDFDRRLSLAEEEWAQLSEKERRRRAHRNHIAERILTLACPRCGQVNECAWVEICLLFPN